MEYFISDTHFSHYNIIQYCDRPFPDITKMNNYMIQQWNSIVQKDDIVYFLGDFGFGNANILHDIALQLNGKKIIILGNHDRRMGINRWKTVGFEEVYKKPIELDIKKDNFNKILLSHEPKECDLTTLNIHGHIHNIPLSQEFDKNNHFCVSVEMINYTPITLDEIIEKMR